MATANALRIVIEAVDRARPVLKSVRKELSRFEREVQRSLKRAFSVGAKAAAAALLALTTSVVAFGGNFEQSMANVRAITGATAVEFVQLGDAAKEMGRTTVFSASEAAKALELLGLAGFNVKESIAALPGVLALAASTGVDLAESTSIVAEAVRAFGLAAAESSRVADVFSKTITSTNTDLLTFREAFKFVAPVAATAGAQIEEVSAAIGQLANFGIKGSIAGTALRNAYIALQDPMVATKQAFRELGLAQATGVDGTVSLTQALEILAQKGASTAQVIELFGKRSGPAIQALRIGGVDALRDLTAALQAAEGAAKRAADVRLDTLFGDFKLFTSKIEGLAIDVFEKSIGPLFRTVVQAINKGLDQIAKANVGDKIRDGLLSVVDAIPRMLAFAEPFITFLEYAAKFIAEFGASITRAIDMIPGPIQQIGLIGFFMLGLRGKAAVLFAIAAMDKLGNAFGELHARTGAFSSALESLDLEGMEAETLVTSLDTVGRQMELLTQRSATFGDALKSSLGLRGASADAGKRAEELAKLSEKMAEILRLRGERGDFSLDVDIAPIEARLASVRGQLDGLRKKVDAFREAGAGASIADQSELSRINETIAPLARAEKALQSVVSAQRQVRTEIKATDYSGATKGLIEAAQEGRKALRAMFHRADITKAQLEAEKSFEAFVENLRAMNLEALERMRKDETLSARERGAIAQEFFKKLGERQAQLTRYTLANLDEQLAATAENTRERMMLEQAINEKQQQFREIFRDRTIADLQDILKAEVLAQRERAAIAAFRQDEITNVHALSARERELIERELTARLNTENEKYRQFTVAQLVALTDDHNTQAGERLIAERILAQRLKETDGEWFTFFRAGLTDQIAQFDGARVAMVKLGAEAANKIQGVLSDSLVAVFKGRVDMMRNIWRDFARDMVDTFREAVAKMIANRALQSLVGQGAGAGQFFTAGTAGLAAAGVGLGVASAGVQSGSPAIAAAGGGITGAAAGAQFGPWGILAGAGIGALLGGITAAVEKSKQEARKAREEQERIAALDFANSTLVPIRFALMDAAASVAQFKADLDAANNGVDEITESIADMTKNADDLAGSFKAFRGLSENANVELQNLFDGSGAGFADMAASAQGNIENMRFLLGPVLASAIRESEVGVENLAERIELQMRTTGTIVGGVMDNFAAAVDSLKARVSGLKAEIERIAKIRDDAAAAITGDIRQIRLEGQSAGERFATFGGELDSAMARLAVIDRMDSAAITDDIIAERQTLTDEVRNLVRAQLDTGIDLIGTVEGLRSEQAALLGDQAEIIAKLNDPLLTISEQTDLTQQLDDNRNEVAKLQPQLDAATAAIQAAGLDSTTTVDALRNAAVAKLESVKTTNDSFYERALALYESQLAAALLQFKELQTVASRVSLLQAGVFSLVDQGIDAQQARLEAQRGVVAGAEEQLKASEKAQSLLGAFSELANRAPELQGDVGERVRASLSELGPIFEQGIAKLEARAAGKQGEDIGLGLRTAIANLDLFGIDEGVTAGQLSETELARFFDALLFELKSPPTLDEMIAPDIVLAGQATAGTGPQAIAQSERRIEVTTPITINIDTVRAGMTVDEFVATGTQALRSNLGNFSTEVSRAISRDGSITTRQTGRAI